MMDEKQIELIVQMSNLQQKQIEALRTAAEHTLGVLKELTLQCIVLSNRITELEIRKMQWELN